MKLFIHALVTLEYFNLKRKYEFKRFIVYFHCFSNNCCLVTAGGNEINPHLNHYDHSFNGSLDL